MNKKLIIFLLTLASLLTIQLYNTPTGHIVAQGGQITQLTLTGTPEFAGIYGYTSQNGVSNITLTSDTIQNVQIQTQNTSCSKQYIIATNTQTLGELNEITPEAADALIGKSPLHPTSYTQMYTYRSQQLGLQLPTLQTNGQLGNYEQSIAQHQGEIAYITEEKRNGQSFNGQSATYQMLLPEGKWYFHTQEPEICLDNLIIDDPQTQDSYEELQLKIILPDRLCAQEELRFYATQTRERIQCREADLRRGCNPQENIELRIQQASQTVTTQTTNQDGYITQNLDEGTYTIYAQTTNQTTSREFSTRNCAIETPITQETIRETQRNTVVINQTPIQQPQTQLPKEIQQTYYAIYLLVLSALLLGVSVYAYEHRNDNSLVLQLRILYYTIKRKLL